MLMCTYSFYCQFRRLTSTSREMMLSSLLMSNFTELFITPFWFKKFGNFFLFLHFWSYSVLTIPSFQGAQILKKYLSHIKRHIFYNSDFHSIVIIDLFAYALHSILSNTIVHGIIWSTDQYNNIQISLSNISWS